MRDAYHEELDAISEQLVEMSALARGAIGLATTALLDADLAAAEGVIAGDETIDVVYHEIEERCYALLARQQPVASDLRLLVTTLRMVADVERAGDMALHVAKVARRRYPAFAVPDELRGTVAEMGSVAQRIMTKTGEAIRGRDVVLAEEIEHDDDAMDDLQRRIFTVLLADTWRGGIEGAIDVTLVGRYYERFADHAVSVGRRVVYLVTGRRVNAADVS